MVVDERSRHELHRRLDELLGAEAAITLMEHPPPVGWADVATKSDLSSLEARIDMRFDRVDDRFARIEERFDVRLEGIETKFDERLKAMAGDLRGAFEHELRQQTMTMMFGLVSVVLTMAVLAFALARFT